MPRTPFTVAAMAAGCLVLSLTAHAGPAGAQREGPEAHSRPARPRAEGRKEETHRHGARCAPEGRGGGAGRPKEALRSRTCADRETGFEGPAQGGGSMAREERLQPRRGAVGRRHPRRARPPARGQARMVGDRGALAEGRGGAPRSRDGPEWRPPSAEGRGGASGRRWCRREGRRTSGRSMSMGEGAEVTVAVLRQRPRVPDRTSTSRLYFAIQGPNTRTTPRRVACQSTHRRSCIQRPEPGRSRCR